jgi:hypothetical protein
LRRRVGRPGGGERPRRDRAERLTKVFLAAGRDERAISRSFTIDCRPRGGGRRRRDDRPARSRSLLALPPPRRVVAGKTGRLPIFAQNF